ncbi:hypothetical protein GJ698_20330 [Pseudoduganella sp. FT26W]|uniref:SLATT domain-containing protein n=1 Tax=Duganella aquatilis TaxID=2666082 RepID=A0A844D8Q5_9BURK|nr:hypothetical protein [Duganella aquatilis]MRW86425.1 hypothetical protein [Duganella aquatilis]
MAIDPRDVIWDEAQDLLYHVSYAETLITALLARWVWLDTISKIVVAISSGGAALTGLVFWKNSDYTFLWPMFTSASTLLAIISSQLDVAEKLKRHSSSTAELRNLGMEIGSMIVRMKINSGFPVAEFEEQLLELRRKYGSETAKFLHDLLLTRHLRSDAQVMTNQKLDIS